MKLYETYLELEDIWNDVRETEEITDHQLDELENQLQQIEGERDKKALSIACWIKNLKAESEALKGEIANLQKRKSVCDNTQERIKTYLQGCIEPGTKIKDARASIGWRKSERVEYSGDIDDLPDEYVRVKKEINKTSMKEDLKAGEYIECASLKECKNITIK